MLKRTIMTEKVNYFILGGDAERLGADSNENPFEVDTDEYYQWDTGWCDSRSCQSGDYATAYDE